TRAASLPPPRQSGSDIVPAKSDVLKGVIGSHSDVRFGSKADICGATSHVRFTPNCDRKSGYLRFVMSSLPPRADMCSALAHVCFGPKADSCAASLVNQLVGAFEHCRWDSQTELFGSLQVDNELEFGGLLDWNIARLRTLKNHTHIVGCTSLEGGKTWPVRNQSATVHKFPCLVDRSQVTFRGEIYDPLTVFACKRINKCQQRIKLFAVDRGKRSVETNQIVHPDGLEI